MKLGEKLFQFTANNPDYLIVLGDLQGRLRYISASSGSVLGYEPDELKAVLGLELVHPDDQERVRQLLANIGQQEQTRLIFRCREKSGEYRWLETDITILRDSASRTDDVVAIARDVTRRREAEEQGGNPNSTLESRIVELTKANKALASACQRAEGASQASSDFLIRMSHEIRTPVNLINGMISLLLDSPLTEKQRHHLGISYRNVRRLLRLINGISDLSMVEAGQLVFHVAPFDLDELLSECAATILAAIERKGLQLEIKREANAWRHWVGDTERLQQVLLNLIGNAIKFTEQGGIEVSVFPERSARGECGLRFEVSDTGCGVPPDKAQLIFESFQQVDGSINRLYEGSGLGLAIAKALVQRMSGTIWLDEKPTPGCKFVFTVFLPLATEQAVREKEQSKIGGGATQHIEQGTRILLVEDNPENAILVQAYLEGLPVSLDLAANGFEAVEKARYGQYHLILMDIQMPVMDGYTATREIRALERTHGSWRVPIVALTAHALTGAMADCISAGCDWHLSKPVERQDLIAAIGKFAERPASNTPAVPAGIAALRPVFLANRRSDLEKIRTVLPAADFATIQRIAHNWKGTGKGYGFPEISEIGAAVEKAAKAFDSNQIEEQVGRLEHHLAQWTN